MSPGTYEEGVIRSESEVRWIRAKNHVGQRAVVTNWHAIVPGLGHTSPPPGTACGIGLSGSLQMVSHSAVTTLDGKRHGLCVDLAEAYIADIDPSPGPLRAADPEVKLAPPGSTSKGSGAPGDKAPF